MPGANALVICMGIPETGKAGNRLLPSTRGDSSRRDWPVLNLSPHSARILPGRTDFSRIAWWSERLTCLSPPSQICEAWLARCLRRTPTALATWIIQWGAEASSDLLRRSARCSRCAGNVPTRGWPGNNWKIRRRL